MISKNIRLYANTPDPHVRLIVLIRVENLVVYVGIAPGIHKIVCITACIIIAVLQLLHTWPPGYTYLMIYIIW